MNYKLMYVGITHETAQVHERTYFAFNEEQKQTFSHLLTQRFAIKAFTIVTTCNRTEIYFESDRTTPYDVRALLIEYVEALHHVRLSTRAFLIFDRTIDTVNHLLHVANGLRSAVIGDKQIIQQVKASYLTALAQKNQGSLLERAFQAVFRSHKRVSKESLYRQGSTSTAYSSLKMIEAYFGKENTQHLKVLVVGAGEIAEDVLKYLPNFSFAQTFISNRTAQKATQLAQQYQIETYDWQAVEANSFTDFDVIITAVSHRKHLITQSPQDHRTRLWIDLAMPSNIATTIVDYHNQVYNIDEVANQVHSTSEAQLQAIPIVEQILQEELGEFIDWLKKDKIRAFLKSYKNHIKQTVLQTAPQTMSEETQQLELANYAEQLANKLVRKSAKTLFHLHSGALTGHQLTIINNAFGI